MSQKPSTKAKTSADTEGQVALTVRRHMRFGWASLLAFLTLGLALEGLHGLKVGWYLDVASSTRRLMFTLGHAHGTLLALVNIAYALTIPMPTTAFVSPPRFRWGS